MWSTVATIRMAGLSARAAKTDWSDGSLKGTALRDQVNFGDNPTVGLVDIQEGDTHFFAVSAC